MMGPTHKLVGGSTAFVATTAAGMPMTVVVGAVICATVASPMPDHAEKVFHLRHRRLTHRPSVQLAFFAVWGLAGVVLVPQFAGLIVVMAASLTVGCVMHSVADSMTVEKDGIQLLWNDVLDLEVLPEMPVYQAETVPVLRCPSCRWLFALRSGTELRGNQS
jgi:membrane-bound metal-dependent hydrolase YbcI (DUF457 family)